MLAQCVMLTGLLLASSIPAAYARSIQRYLRELLFHLQLYRQTGYLRSQIGEEDYRRLFQAMWQDRARVAGWELDPSDKGDTCILRLKLKRGKGEGLVHRRG
jgi:hypothetical protein